MNIATVMVASIALGVIDDDTVHFIVHFRREMAFGTVLASLILCLPSLGGDLEGHIEFLGVVYPRQDLLEVRSRLFSRYDTWLDHNWYLRVAAYADGVVGSSGREAAAIVCPHEIYLERRSDRFEFRFGFSNVVWGVLDEIQPTDRINPLDVSRFVLEGRSEARLPVPLTRARFFLPGDLTIEAIWVPFPRGGTFDQLDEATSPFNPLNRLQPSDLPPSRLARTARNMEFGARIEASRSGLDWALSVYRDVLDFDRFQAGGPEPSPPSLLIPPSPSIEALQPPREALQPPRWMLGAELETVAGAWTLRGEAALDLNDPLQGLVPLRIIESWSFQAGMGMDRRYGDSTLFFSGIYRSVPDQPDLLDEDELTLVGGLDRTFSRGTRSLRLFGVWSPDEDSGFLRAILGAEIVENLRAELSGGLFLGEGQNLFTLLNQSDFVLARLRIFF